MIVIIFFIEKKCFLIFNKNQREQQLLHQSQWPMIEKTIIEKTLWPYPGCEYIKSQFLMMEETIIAKTLWLYPNCEYIKTSCHPITYAQ